jgi:hypothetical protein
MRLDSLKSSNRALETRICSSTIHNGVETLCDVRYNMSTRHSSTVLYQTGAYSSAFTIIFFVTKAVFAFVARYQQLHSPSRVSSHSLLLKITNNNNRQAQKATSSAKMQREATVQETWMKQQSLPSTLAPAMHNDILRAALMNQQGASCIIASNIKQAATWFAGALQLLRFQLPVSIQKTFHMASHSPQDDGRFQPDESRCFVYSKPLLFNPEAVITEEDILSYTAVVTFNLGLAHQLEGYALHDDGRFLATANDLYDATLHHLLNSQLRHDCSNIILASLNNLACLNAELYKFDQAYHILLCMEIMIQEGRVRTDTIDADDLSNVLLNIRLLTMPVCAGKA